MIGVFSRQIGYDRSTFLRVHLVIHNCDRSGANLFLLTFLMSFSSLSYHLASLFFYLLVSATRQRSPWRTGIWLLLVVPTLLPSTSYYWISLHKTLPCPYSYLNYLAKTKRLIVSSVVGNGWNGNAYMLSVRRQFSGIYQYLKCSYHLIQWFCFKKAILKRMWYMTTTYVYRIFTVAL